MGLLTSLAKRGGKAAAPRVGKIAPGATDGFLQRVLDRAIRGAGPFDPARQVADDALKLNDGDVEAAIDALVTSHSKLAATQGFVTNVGGLITLPVSIPANVAGLTLVQLRLHAAIAHLRGHDLADPGVRAAVLVTLLGHDETKKLVRKGDLPGNARWLAAGGSQAPDISEKVAAEVAATLVGLLGGKQMATFVGKRVPLFGGVVGAATDARATWTLGRDAGRDLAVARE